MTARDIQFWTGKLLPISIGVLGATLGVLPVHCACLEWKGSGLLIAGASGAGKSTLSVALAQRGFQYVSDDWTYASEKEEKLVAHGTSAPVKLLPDALQHFHALSNHAPHISMNGELAYEVDAAGTFGARVVNHCEPRWLLFLERTATRGSEFIPLPPAQVRTYLESSVEKLPSELYQAAAKRAGIIDRIECLPSWKFQYGGTPDFAARRLMEFAERNHRSLDNQEVFA